MYLSILTALIRLAMAPVITWLMNKQIITSDQSIILVTDIATWTAAAGLTVWAWVKAHRKTNTALAMPKGSTPNDLKDQMATGNTAPAMAPPDVAPKIIDK